jgi:protein translocase SecG subunit
MVSMLSIVQLALAILLTILILVQRANTDAGGALGSDGGTATHFEKRGAERTIHRFTIIVAVVFVLSLAYPILF